MKKLSINAAKRKNKLITGCLLILLAVMIVFVFNRILPQFIVHIQSFIEAFISYLTKTQYVFMNYMKDCANQESLWEQLDVYSQSIWMHIREAVTQLYPALLDTGLVVVKSMLVMLSALLYILYILLLKQMLMNFFIRYKNYSGITSYQVFYKTLSNFLKQGCRFCKKFWMIRNHPRFFSLYYLEFINDNRKDKPC